MPNWCRNYLIVKGPATDLVTFEQKARGYPPTYKPHRNERATKSTEEETPDEAPLNFHSLVPVPRGLLVRTYGAEEERELEGCLDKVDGFDNGFEWEFAHWGCKWVASVFKVTWENETTLSYDFDTAWSPPIAFFQKASELFPTLKFRLEFCEPMENFKGWATITNGLADIVKSECKVVAGESDFGNIARELAHGHDVILYEQHESFPELHRGIELPTARIRVRRSGSRYHVHLFGDKDRMLLTTDDIEELRELCERIADDPEGFLWSEGLLW